MKDQPTDSKSSGDTTAHTVGTKPFDMDVVRCIMENWMYVGETGELSVKTWTPAHGNGAPRYSATSGYVFAGFQPIKGHTDASRYIITPRICGKPRKAHRVAYLLATGSDPCTSGKVIDHINGDRSDNRLVNLRVVSKSENSQNTKITGRRSATGILGVNVGQNGKFVSRIRHNGRSVYLGEYDTPELAQQAYLSAKMLLHPGFPQNAAT